MAKAKKPIIQDEATSAHLIKDIESTKVETNGESIVLGTKPPLADEDKETPNIEVKTTEVKNTNIPDLTPNQVRNMSHEAVAKYYARMKK